MGGEERFAGLLDIFLTELQDHVRALERDLLSIEKTPGGPQRVELFNALFRTAHSLKGAARAMNVDAVETACHRLEEIFSGARDGSLPLEGDVFQLLLATTDAIRESGRLLNDNSGPVAAPLAAFLPQLAAITVDISKKGRRPVTPPPAPPVPPAEMPAATPAPAPATEGEGLVRVAAGKLDSLITQSSQLLVARVRAQSSRDRVAWLQDFVRGWRAERRNAALASGQLLSVREAQGRAVGDGISRPRLPGYRMRTERERQERLERLERELQALSRDLAEDHRTLEQMTSQLHVELRRIRMFPFSDACERLERTVRDLSSGGEKKVRLTIEGSGIEIDRSILDGLKDPLLHLVRNAVDHGIEPAAVRKAAGKPETGTVTIRAALRGASVSVAIEDDGRGLDLAAIREQAHARGLHLPEDDDELAQLVFLSGFSTSSSVSRISGRGIGLDVVKTSVEAMRGLVTVWSRAGEGTRFTLTLPLTLTTIRGLLVSAGGALFAIDSAAVQSLQRIRAEDLEVIEGRQVLPFGDQHVPIIALSDVLGLHTKEARAPAGKQPVVLLSYGQRRAALTVDELVSEQEVVVQSAGPRLEGVRTFAGATVLSDGRIAPILNTAEIIQRLIDMRAASGSWPAVLEKAAPRSKRLLVVDDSVTTRTLEKNILEAAGYEVVVAPDGAEAWRILQEGGADLVVSDVQMPRMDGFTLTETIRQSKRFRELPVVLVTAQENDEDKARGIEVGADAYILKGSFDQKDLLDAVAQLL